jgi:Raf kinase inhibitor-like YbhB/YbcL family protein
MRSFFLLACLALTACSSNGTPADVDAAPVIDAAVGLDVVIDGPGLTLTSPVLTEGGAISAVNTCNGANTSPQLDWIGQPSGTLSYAVVLTDKSNQLVHAVIYDIPATATGLPANVEKLYTPSNVPGAHQTSSYQTAVRGYNGPCPPSQHTYEFALYALDVATLPGATMGTTRSQALTLIQAHDLAMATLTGTYTP